MTTQKDTPQGSAERKEAPANDPRKEKLAKALRANLLRRKEAARASENEAGE